jgi:hypothetical protein
MLDKGDIVCPICGGPLKVHGIHARHVIDGYGTRHDGWAAQARCRACNKYPTLIPEFIMPYKHYTAEVIEAVLWEREEAGGLGLSSCPADGSTMQRWVAQFNRRGAMAVGWLLSILYTVFGQHLSALELQGKGAMEQLARITQALPNPGAAGVVGKANVILSRHNYGFL